MRVKKLHINSFRYLENLTLDFIYPDDFHIEEKRGKPLDKICIIGQSATGKTSLLELINEQLTLLQEVLIEDSKNTYLTEKSNFSDCVLDVDLNGKSISTSKNSLKIDNHIYKDARNILAGGAFSNIFNSTFKSYYFKSNLISEKNIETLNLNPIELREMFTSFKKPINSTNSDSIIFSDEIDSEIWYRLLSEFIDFHSKRYQKFNDLIGKGLIANLNKFNSEVQKFLDKNPNPIEKFGKKFNILLEKLFLEIDYNNTEFSISIKNKRKDEVIPIQDISTGTKGLLLSCLPLYQLDTNNTFIFIDEPERSLYPDIQMELMDFYQSLAPGAQFIVATHSPFIAASFEPCERFILYFEDNGKINVKRGISPIGDDPNDILKQDFGLEFLMNKNGLEAFERFKKLKKELAEETEETKKTILLDEILTLANAYRF